jgi:hypothetical protein
VRHCGNCEMHRAAHGVGMENNVCEHCHACKCLEYRNRIVNCFLMLGLDSLGTSNLYIANSNRRSRILVQRYH